MAKTLRRMRKERQMTQKRLSDLSGVPRICISRYENGKHQPSIENAAKIANALDVNISELLDFDKLAILHEYRKEDDK